MLNTIMTYTASFTIASIFVILAASTLMSGMVLPDAFAQFQSGGVDKEGTWYAGEGLKHGDYFSYSMCYVDYKECSKFRLDLWMKGDIQVGSETKWLAEVVVHDGNRIVVGEMELGKLVPEPTGSTEELAKYRGPFKSSIVWLSAFATADGGHGGEGPKAFKATSWGKIANIGGEQVMPRELESVSVAGKTWDAVIIGWRTGGAVSQIWIADDFPFPIKANTFTHVSEGIPPTEYEFVLLDYKENVTQSPFVDVIPTRESLVVQGCDVDFNKDITVKKQTVGAMYQIYVSYGPEEPKQGCNMEWIIKFHDKYDETEFLNQVHFDVLTVDENFRPIRSLAQEDGKPFLYSPSGLYLLDLPIREEPGVENYVIWVHGLSPEHIVPSDPSDYVEIPITILYNDKLDAVERPIDDELVDSDTTQIPNWIKQNAGWWADGLIDDSSFVQGVQYLISQEIIQIPMTTHDPSAIDTTIDEIPAWIKTNAKWWADGTIDDNTFVLAIQYLIKNGIMVVS